RLFTSWVADGVKAAGKQYVDGAKGIALDALMNFVGKTSDAFEPVVEDTTDFSSRLREGIYDRAKALKRKMDEIVEEAELWSVPAALALRQGFLTGCPFLTDEPQDKGAEFEKTFQDESELAMWVAWALKRDEAYWKKAQAGGIWDPYANVERHAFDPILERLMV